MKKKDMDMQVAFAWYKPEQWTLLKAYSVDKDEIEDTFAEWLEHAERSFKEYEESGLNMHKVQIDIDALVAWCKERDVPVDGDARSKYAAALLQEIDTQP